MKKRVVVLLAMILAMALTVPTVLALVTPPTIDEIALFEPVFPDADVKVEGINVTVSSPGNFISFYYDDGGDWLHWAGEAEGEFTCTLPEEGREFEFYIFKDDVDFNYSSDGFRRASGHVKQDGKGKAIMFYYYPDGSFERASVRPYIVEEDGSWTWQDGLGIYYNEDGTVDGSHRTIATETGWFYYAFDGEGNPIGLHEWLVEESRWVNEFYLDGEGQWMQCKYDPDTGRRIGDEPVDTVPADVLKKYNVALKGWRAPDFPNNTVCAAGISLREEYPGLTDKWYHVVPIDLTQDGQTVLPLVASNLYYIGEATVTVKDGKVSVTYSYKKGRMAENAQVLNWFTDIDDITTEYLDAPQGKYAFGQPVDIKEDLDNAGLGYLFICNNITYYRDFYPDGGRLCVFRYDGKKETEAREPLLALMANPPVQPTPEPTEAPTPEPTVESTEEPPAESTEAPTVELSEETVNLLRNLLENLEQNLLGNPQ